MPNEMSSLPKTLVHGSSNCRRLADHEGEWYDAGRVQAGGFHDTLPLCEATRCQISDAIVCVQ